MSKAEQTKAALFACARQLFWSRGYSNVPLREIARAVGVDVALIARYFGSKIGLFDATLEGLPELDPSSIDDRGALVEFVVNLLVAVPRDGTRPAATTFVLMNAGDPEVGEAVRELFESKWQQPLDAIIGDKEKAALFTAVMFGMSMAENTLRLGAIASPQSDEYKDQLRGLLMAALTVEQTRRRQI